MSHNTVRAGRLHEKVSPLCTRSARWAQEGYGDRDNDLHPKRQHSHQLRAGEIPFIIESPVMSRNAAGAGRLWEKVEPHEQQDFFP
jgi:hypothetical protein